MRPLSSVALTSVRALGRYVKSFVPENISGTSRVPHSRVFKYSPKNIDKLICDNVIGKNTSLSPQTISNSKPSELSGHPIGFGRSREATILSPEDAEQFSTVLSPGLGWGSSAKSIYESYFPVSQLIDNKDLLVYSPLTDADRREGRFKKGLMYYYDESYINEEESENFFNKILKNRFFDKDGKLKNPGNVSNLMLFGFSIGHRENISHMNYLHERIAEALVREGKSPDLVQEYFTKIALINIASPVNWEGLRLPKEMLSELESGSISMQDAEEAVKEYMSQNKSPKSKVMKLPELKIINYRSFTDVGTLKLESDFNNFNCNRRFAAPKIFKFLRPDRESEVLYVMGKSLVPDVFFDDGAIKDDSLGHNLSNYARAIFDNSETMFPILVLRSTEHWHQIQDVQQSGVIEIAYNPNRAPSDLDRAEVRQIFQETLFARNAMINALSYVQDLEDGNEPRR
ncbi:MAG: hypothetical protein V4612_06510 [Pseudomonadota bacterium]